MQQVVGDGEPDGDGELVRRLRRGEGAAFKQLIDAHGTSLYRMALRVTRDEAEAEDAVQDGLVLLVRRLDTFRSQSSLSTWMHRVVINAARMRLRRAYHRHETTDLTGDDPVATLSPVDELLMREQTRKQTRSAIEQLPKTHRDVLWLRYVRELSTADIAVELGVSTGAAKVRLHRARAAFAGRVFQGG